MNNSDSIKKIDCVIFAAMPEELEFCKKHFSECQRETVIFQGFHFDIYEYNNKQIALACMGIGTAFASCIVTLVNLHFSPTYMFLIGTAGGIHKGLDLCDVIIVETAFEAEIQGVFELAQNTPFEGCLTHPLKQQRFPTAYSADETLLKLAHSICFSDVKVYSGNVVTSNTFPAPLELFARIKQSAPYSIDMETSAFYQVGWLLEAKALAVRGISNILNIDGTDDKLHQADIDGSITAASRALLQIIDRLDAEPQAKNIM